MTQATLDAHVADVLACTRCPQMHRPAVTGRPIQSPVMLVGQAPGVKEPEFGRPFAWTAGKLMFKWFAEHCGIDEEAFRSRMYMAAVCRCFPGKHPNGRGDRVPDATEVATCRDWMLREFDLLQPRLIIPVGKLAISQFMKVGPLVDMIGKSFVITLPNGQSTTVIPLPHPSGASPWPRMEPGKSLTRDALALINAHEAFREARDGA